MASVRYHRGKYQVRVRRQDTRPITRTFTLRKHALEWARHMEVKEMSEAHITEQSVKGLPEYGRPKRIIASIAASNAVGAWDIKGPPSCC